MAFLADTLLAAGSIGAAVYCYILSQRLSRFSRLEGGIGGAVAVLSAQVDDMTVVLHNAQAAAVGSAGSLDELTRRAEAASTRLELLLATLHDLPEAGEVPTGASRRRVVRRRMSRDVEMAE